MLGSNWLLLPARGFKGDTATVPSNTPFRLEAAGSGCGRGANDWNVRWIIGRRRGHIRQQVVEEGVVAELISAADDHLAVAVQERERTRLRVPRKADRRTEILVRRVHLAGNSERRRVLAGVRGESEDIRRLAEILIPQTRIQREGGRDFPAVLHEQRPAEQVGSIHRAAELLS